MPEVYLFIYSFILALTTLYLLNVAFNSMFTLLAFVVTIFICLILVKYEAFFRRYT